jgi:hypothetical protein
MNLSPHTLDKHVICFAVFAVPLTAGKVIEHLGPGKLEQTFIMSVSPFFFLP